MTVTPVAKMNCTLTRSSSFVKAKDTITVTGLFGEKLEISLHRTIRVPDGDGDSELPPSMGNFPLYSVANHKDKLPAAMTLKGGLFLPMYQREAMWIRFQSKFPFAIKVYLGGINAVSGEPMVENAATKFRRLNLLGNEKSIQDYVITPDQLWLDGIASNDGRVRQFVGMPLGSGYSVEAQMAGEDVMGGLQFEITPTVQQPKLLLPPLPRNLRVSGVASSRYPVTQVFIKTLTGKTIMIDCVSPSTSLGEIMDMIQDKEGIPADQQRLICNGWRLEEDRTLGEYNFPDQTEIYLIQNLIGGGAPRKDWELGIAPGGLIKQCILEDKHLPSIWAREHTICFNVQILNSEAFRQVTGNEPPATPVTAKTYASHGLPYFKIYNEESNIKGDFAGIKSVKAIDKVKAKATAGQAAVGKGKFEEHEEPSLVNPMILLNPHGNKMGFRPVSELERELSSMNAVQF